jgi:hypothetical protein
MANNITGNPWSLDTAGVIATFPVYVKSLVWQGFTANGTDTLTILDNAGRTIINSNTNTTGDVMDFGDFRWVEGFHITLIGSGIVTVVVHK